MLPTPNIEQVRIEPIPSTRKIHLVFISGVAGAGKTTCAKYLVDRLYDGRSDYALYNVVIYPLAEPIKELAYRSFGWNGLKDERGRRLLQVLGTDAGRNYNPNIWVEKLADKIEVQIPLPNFVFVDDWRFKNEADYFNDNFLYEITRIRVDRKLDTGKPAYFHESETSLPGVFNKDYYDFFIDNNGTLEELYSKLDGILAYLETKIIYR